MLLGARVRSLLLAAVGLTVLACSSSPDWVSSSDSSLCTYDVALHSIAPLEMDLVVVVDDSPSAVPSRPMFRDRSVTALRAILADRVTSDPKGKDPVTDLHILVRGASTQFEQRLDYLADAPDNAWKTRHGEIRDRDAFVTAYGAALDAMPVGRDTTPLVDRVRDLRRGEGALREVATLVLLFLTAHDDASQALSLPADIDLMGDMRRYATYVSAVVDRRAWGTSTSTGGPKCAMEGWAPGDGRPHPNSVPRLIGAAGRLVMEVFVAEVCGDGAIEGDLLFRGRRFYGVNECLPLPATVARCTILVAPPISGDYAMCDRPELGLSPASSAAHRLIPSDYRESIRGRPLCMVRPLEVCDRSRGEGFCFSASGACGRVLDFTPWAKPVDASWTFLHCEAPRCGRGG